MPAVRKVLSPMDFLALSRLVRYSSMDNNELPAIIYWKYKNDGTVETNCPVSSQPPAPTETPPLLDVDKLIEESTGLYSLWWIAFKKNHPERCLIREEPKEPIIKAPPKPKVTFTPLFCKRCSHTWTPRSKEPPIQCPKCHSPYWNRDRVKRP